jgi:hypothetical protein
LHRTEQNAPIGGVLKSDGLPQIGHFRLGFGSGMLQWTRLSREAAPLH